MKQFISTKFFCVLQKASQMCIDIDAKILQRGYDEFVMLLFSENAVSTEPASYHSALIYTRVEFSRFTEVSEKKCGCVCRKNY